LIALAPGCSSAVSVEPGLAASEHATRPVATVLPPLQDAGEAARQLAAKVIAASRAAYAACGTYEDIGTYDVLFRGHPEVRTRIEFHSAFAGPRAIRFAYRGAPFDPQPARLSQLIVDDAGVRTMVPWA